MASTNVFDLPPMHAVEGLPLNVAFPSGEWSSSTSQNELGMNPVQPVAQHRLYEGNGAPQSLNGGVGSSVMGGVQTPLHAPAQQATQQPSSNVPTSVLPLPYAFSAPTSAVQTPHEAPIEGLGAPPLHDTSHVSLTAGDAAPFTGSDITLATASTLQVPPTSSAGIMNTPSGLRLAFSAPAADAKSSKMTQIVVQPGAASDSEQYLPKIGGLLEELAEKAADARQLFHGAQYDKCSENLSEVRSRLRAISDIGVESLATAVDYQQHKLQANPDEAHAVQAPAPGFSAPAHNSPTLSPEKEQHLFSAAIFSGVQSSPGRRKRPSSTDARELPVKVLRGDLPGAQAMLQRTTELDEHAAARPGTDASAPALFPPVTAQAPLFDLHGIDTQTSPLKLASGTPTAAPAPVHHAPFFGEAGSSQVLLSTPQAEDRASTPKAAPLASLKPRVASETQPALLSRNRANSMGARISPFSHARTEPSTPLATDALRFDVDSLAYAAHNEPAPAPAWAEGQVDALAKTESAGEAHASLAHSRRSSNGTDESGTLPVAMPVGPGGDSSVDESWESVAQLDKAGGSELAPELRKRLDDIFHEFLNSLCSNLDATDDRGEPIHQTLMPKKMARLDESPDFRPFKFRIQAFTNAFQSELVNRGIHEGICSIKKIKQYLWTQPFISRFNEDGKKAKSKGNHIWNIEAKKLPEGGWVFRTFSPKIAGSLSKVAHVNERWTWNLRIWDPQASSSSIKVVYTANTLPSWIHWEDNEKVLTGIPQSTAQSGEVSVTALYVHLGQLHRLEHSFFLKVLPPTDAAQGAAPDVRAEPQATPVHVDAEHAHGTDGLGMMSGASTNGQVLSLPLQGHGMTETPFERESMKYEVVEPSRAPDVLNSIPFPFTPPVYMDNRLQYMGLEPSSSLAAKSDGLTPSQPYSVPNGHALYPGQQPLAGLPQPSPMHQTAVFVGNASVKDAAAAAAAPSTAPAATKTLPQKLMAQDPLRATQLWNMIEQRQQDQVASLMLSIPARRPAFNMNEHPGQGTPISNMPSDMGATLPHIHPHTPNGGP